MKENSKYVTCPTCARKTRMLHRNAPKGEKADFVCYDCVPQYLKPSDAAVVEINEIWEAINNQASAGRRD